MQGNNINLDNLTFTPQQITQQNETTHITFTEGNNTVYIVGKTVQGILNISTNGKTITKNISMTASGIYKNGEGSVQIKSNENEGIKAVSIPEEWDREVVITNERQTAYQNGILYGYVNITLTNDKTYTARVGIDASKAISSFDISSLTFTPQEITQSQTPHIYFAEGTNTAFVVGKTVQGILKIEVGGQSITKNISMTASGVYENGRNSVKALKTKNDGTPRIFYEEVNENTVDYTKIWIELENDQIINNIELPKIDGKTLYQYAYDLGANSGSSNIPNLTFTPQQITQSQTIDIQFTEGSNTALVVGKTVQGILNISTNGKTIIKNISMTAAGVYNNGWDESLTNATVSSLGVTKKSDADPQYYPSTIGGVKRWLIPVTIFGRVNGTKSDNTPYQSQQYTSSDQSVLDFTTIYNDIIENSGGSRTITGLSWTESGSYDNVDATFDKGEPQTNIPLPKVENKTLYQFAYGNGYGIGRNSVDALKTNDDGTPQVFYEPAEGGGTDYTKLWIRLENEKVINNIDVSGAYNAGVSASRTPRTITSSSYHLTTAGEDESGTVWFDTDYSQLDVVFSYGSGQTISLPLVEGKTLYQYAYDKGKDESSGIVITTVGTKRSSTNYGTGLSGVHQVYINGYDGQQWVMDTKAVINGTDYDGNQIRVQDLYDAWHTSSSSPNISELAFTSVRNFSSSIYYSYADSQSSSTSTYKSTITANLKVNDNQVFEDVLVNITEITNKLSLYRYSVGINTDRGTNGYQEINNKKYLYLNSNYELRFNSTRIVDWHDSSELNRVDISNYVNGISISDVIIRAANQATYSTSADKDVSLEYDYVRYDSTNDVIKGKVNISLGTATGTTTTQSLFITMDASRKLSSSSTPTHSIIKDSNNWTDTSKQYNFTINNKKAENIRIYMANSKIYAEYDGENGNSNIDTLFTISTSNSWWISESFVRFFNEQNDDYKDSITITNANTDYNSDNDYFSVVVKTTHNGASKWFKIDVPGSKKTSSSSGGTTYRVVNGSAYVANSSYTKLNLEYNAGDDQEITLPRVWNSYTGEYDSAYGLGYSTGYNAAGGSGGGYTLDDINNARAQGQREMYRYYKMDLIWNYNGYVTQITAYDIDGNYIKSFNAREGDIFR